MSQKANKVFVGWRLKVSWYENMKLLFQQLTCLAGRTLETPVQDLLHYMTKGFRLMQTGLIGQQCCIV